MAIEIKSTVDEVQTAVGQPVVVDTRHSRSARLRPVPVTAVRLEDDFWEPRRRINREVTLPSQFEHCEATGRIDNFRRASGKRPDLPFQGIFFNDSDVYKWLEAAAWSLATDPDPELERMVDVAITEIEDAQQPDGYLNTYFMFEHAAERWTNLKDLHEMYCAGHLFQAAVAHKRATGSDRLLNVACRFADLICATFGPEDEGKRPGTDGHEEIEMALVELARVTGDLKYLRQAEYFVEVRGQGVAGGSPYHQDHKPFRELDQMVGHAVRAVYYNAGAADLYLENGDATLRTTLERLWMAMTARQMYVSGGIGSRYEGEAFGRDYELPNERAYTETCAAIGSAMWNWRMLSLEGDARYADLIELQLYNAMLPGLSLDGQSYFYQNPLADDGTHRRQPWFGCACCPPNVARTLSSLPGYCYSVADDGVYMHLYAEGSAEIALADGQTVTLRTRTRYPWDGDIAVEVDGEGQWTLRLRVPGWCEAGARVEVNGTLLSDDPVAGGRYVEIRRRWERGDQVRLRLPMPVRRVVAHPYALENSGRVALMRGPLLYCVEQAGNLELDPRDLALRDDAPVEAGFEAELLNGVVALHFEASLAPPERSWSDTLYRTLSSKPTTTEVAPVRVVAIPYYAWANRAPGHMEVWLRRG